MKGLSPLRGRWTAVGVVALTEATVAFAFGTVAAFPWVVVLRKQPEGVRALRSVGGRFVLDVLERHATGITAGALAALAGVGLWSVTWLLLGGVFPVLFATDEAPPLHRAMSLSVRRAPTLMALAALAVVAYAITGVIGALGWAHATHKALLLADPRAGDLRRLSSLIPAVLLAILVSVWHDVARTQAMASGVGSMAATAGALRRILRTPVQTLGRAAGYTLLGAVGVLIAAGVSYGLGGRGQTVALVAIVVVQQASVAWRLVCRALWFAWLAAPWRSAATGSTTPRG